MSIASEITRLQNAKASLKTSINAKSTTQITNETLEDYASFVDNIQSGSDISEYISAPTTSAVQRNAIIGDLIKKMPDITLNNSSYSLFAYNCEHLEEVGDIRNTNIPNIYSTKTISYMFRNCYRLHTIGEIDGAYIDYNNPLEAFYNCTELTNFGGFKDLGRYMDSSGFASEYAFTLNMGDCTKLTKQSVDNIVSKLYTMPRKRQKIIFAPQVYALLTQEQIDEASAKKWDIVSSE